MFGIGGWELVIIAVLGLLLFGPDKLPEIIRTVSRFMRDFKRYQAMMESTFKNEMLAFDELVKDDGTKKPETKKTSKEFNKKVAGGTYTKKETAPKTAEAAKKEEASEAKATEADDSKKTAETSAVESKETSTSKDAAADKTSASTAAAGGISEKATGETASEKKPVLPGGLPYAGHNAAAATAVATAAAVTAAKKAAEAAAKDAAEEVSADVSEKEESSAQGEEEEG